MRMDKLTSRFQQALADAQSLAVGRDHNMLEPVHVMIALLDQQGGSTTPLLSQAGINVPLLRERLGEMLNGLPQGQRSGRRHQRRQCPGACPQPDRQAGPAARRPVHRQRAVRAGGAGRRRRAGQGAQGRRSRQGAYRGGDRQDPRRREGRQRECRGPAPGAGEVHHRPDRARRVRQAGPGDRPRRGDPPRDPGAAAAHQEQPGADRRARRGQDRHRRRAWPSASSRTRCPRACAASVC